MTVKELKARLEEFNENAVMAIYQLTMLMGNLSICRQQAYAKLKMTGESYGEVLMLDVEQDKIVVYNTLKI